MIDLSVRNTGTNNAMNNDFIVVAGDGKWIVTPKEKPAYDKFRIISKKMKEHGGTLANAKDASFIFKEEPTWLNTTELNSQTKPRMITEVKPKKQAPSVKSKIKKGTQKSPAKKTPPKAIEYEIYKQESFETCTELIEELISSHSKPEDDPSHVMLLRLLRNACTNDEDLRANITHKDYDKVLHDAAYKWAFEIHEKDPAKNGGECSPATIFPYVLEEYKRPVIKKVAPPKEVAKKMAKSK